MNEFNSGRQERNGFYAISVATAYRQYYALWRIFADGKQPLFIRTLTDKFATSVSKVMEVLRYGRVVLKWVDSRYFAPYYEQTYELLSFGKYRGKRISEVYYIDPMYVLWLANRFTPEKKKLQRIVGMAKAFAEIHAELASPRRVAYRSASEFVGQKGGVLADLKLKVLFVGQQVDTYKPDFYIDQRVLAADERGNRFCFTEKAAGRSLTPKVLNCYSRTFAAGETVFIRSARVMEHYESRGVKYTRLGYVKYLR